MRHILSFLISGLVAGATFYLLELLFSNVLGLLIVTFDSNPTSAITGYGNDVAVLAAAGVALFAWVEIYRYMVTPTLI